MKAQAKPDPKAAANAKDAKDAKDRKPTPKDAKKQLLDKKGKPIIQEPEEPEVVLPPPEKPKTLERYIYVTTYTDQEFMKSLKEVFETINKEAFQLKSVKEIYTRVLSDVEQNNNEIDYISGFQIIDSVFRITIVEGISGKSMELIKNTFVKKGVNSSYLKIFSNSKFLFNKRLYSPFNLCIKFIKLRETLQQILTTPDIYNKSKKYCPIYNAFMQLGFIMQAENFQQISDAKQFPESEALLLLERKYADILIDEDITGIHVEKKKKRKNKTKDMSGESSMMGSLGMSSITTRNKSTDTHSTFQNTLTGKKETTHKGETKNDTFNIQNEEKKTTTARIKADLKAKLDTKNQFFDEKISLRRKSPKKDWSSDNLATIAKLNATAKTGNFCVKNQLNPSYPSDQDVYLYSSQRKNYYADYMDKKREIFETDKSHYYTYSDKFLTLSFPMIKNKNMAYEEYMENKSKWQTQNGFNRYSTYTKEYAYMPKINNEL